MGNATLGLVGKDLPRLSWTKQDTTRWLPELSQLKPHDKRNGEDTKGTLQVLFPCPIKHVVFIVDISNTVFLMEVHAPSGLSSKVEEKQQFQIIVKKDLRDPES